MSENQTRETQVPAEMSNLKDVLATLEKSIAGTRKRLIPVLFCYAPEGNSDKELETEMVLVPLARDIKNVADRIRALNIEVSSLLRELQL